MRKILPIIAKNLKLILRSRVSALIIIFGPLLLTLLVGMAFNNRGMSSISIGTYSQEYTPLVESFLGKITDSNLTLRKFDSEQGCADSIKRGVVNLCLVFPANFEIPKEGTSDVNNIITFYVDPSQINLVYSVKDIISTQLENRTQELSTELITIVLTTLDNTHGTIQGESVVFNDIARSNEALLKAQNSMASKLGSLDLTFNQNRFGADGIISAKQGILSKLQPQNGTSALKLNQSLKTCSDLKKDPEYNTSSFKTKMDSICTKIESVNTDLNTLNTNEFYELTQGIVALQREITATSQKFTTIKTSRDQIVAVDLRELSSSSGTILNKVMLIKSDLESIQREIDAIPVTESENLISPIKTEVKPIASETYLNYMFPGLLALVVMLVSLLFGQTIMIMEKKSPAYFRNMVTPTKEGLFIFSNFLTTFLLLLLQTFLILGVSTLIFKVDTFGNIFPTILSLIMIITLFSIVGIIIGQVFSSQETSTLAAVSVGSIALFLSDIILPLESMPSYIKSVAQYNPFVLSENLLRNTLVFNTPLSTLLKEAYSGSISVIFLILIYIVVLVIMLIGISRLMNHKNVMIRATKKRLNQKDKEKRLRPIEEQPDATRQIEELLEKAMQNVKEKDLGSAGIIYVQLNELYAMLPSDKKKTYFSKIGRLHEEIAKATKSKK